MFRRYATTLERFNSVLTPCLSVVLGVIVLNTSISVRRIRLVVSRVFLHLHLAWIVLILRSRISLSLSFRYFLVRDDSGSVVSTSSPVLAPVSYMVFSTFLTFVYLLCCTFLLTSIFKAAVHSLVTCAV